MCVCSHPNRRFFDSFNDSTVAFATSLIEEFDPFLEHDTSEMTLYVFLYLHDRSMCLRVPDSELDETYAPIIKAYQNPEPTVKAPKAKFGTKAYWKSFKDRRPLLPPLLQFKFPYNIVRIYLLNCSTLAHLLHM